MNYIYNAAISIFLLIVVFVWGEQHERDSIEAAAKSVRAQDVMIARFMQPQLTHTLTVSHTVTVTLTKQVTKYVDRYIPAPGAASQARPAYMLTWGATRLWNSALSATTSSSPVAATTGPNPLDLSAVSFDDAETNALLNFGQYRDCRTVVAGWQSWYQQVSKVKP